MSGPLVATIPTGERTFDVRFHAVEHAIRGWHAADGSEELTSLLQRCAGLAYKPAPSNPMQLEDTDQTLPSANPSMGSARGWGASTKPTAGHRMSPSFGLSSRGYGIAYFHRPCRPAVLK